MAADDAPRSAAQKVGPVIVCLIFISVGLGLWVPGFLVPVLEWNARRSWKPAPCTIVKSPRDGGGFGVTFRYEWEGSPQEVTLGSDPGFFETPSFELWELQTGASTTCYVNPFRPREAVLRRDFDPELFIWCAPLLFVALPVLALGAMLVRALRPAVPASDSRQARPAGSVVLEPENRSGCGVVAPGCLLLVFGGAIAFLVLLPGFRESLLIRLLYAVPLTFIVLLLLRGIVRSLLHSFNPKLVLTVTPAEGRPGQDVDVRWDAKGSPGGVKRFRLVLVGREEVKRSKTFPLREPFASIDVFQGGPKDFKRGLVKVRIPPAVMPSLEHGSRRIVWVWRLTAEISGLPDLDEEYPYSMSGGKAAGS